MALELHGVPAPEAELRDRIVHVLWGRKDAWAALEAHLISEVELRDLLLGHLDYECADVSGRSWDEFTDTEREPIIHALDQALFGRPAK